MEKVKSFSCSNSTSLGLPLSIKGRLIKGSPIPGTLAISTSKCAKLAPSSFDESDFASSYVP